jgi:PAS domain S-box-containing protein
VFQVRDARGQVSGYATVSRNVTARRHAEEALRKSEEKYRSLFNSLDDGFCVIEVLFRADGRAEDYRFLEVNAAFERHSGLKGVVGKRIREMVPNQDAHWFETYGRVALTGEPKRFATRGEAMNRFFEVYAFRVGEPEERKVAVLFRDETQRRRAEDGLRESEERLRLAAEGVDMGIWDLDLRNNIATRTLRHDQIFGYQEAQPLWTLEIALQHVLPEDRAAISEAFALAQKTGHLTHESRVRWPDGSIHWISVRGRMHFDVQGRPVRVAGVVFDSTDRKMAEEALRKSESRWNAAIESFAEGAIIATEAEDVIYWNPAARQMHGFSSPKEGIEPLADTPKTFELWTPDGSHLLSLDEWPMKRIKRGERVQNLELRLRRPDQGWERFVTYSGTMVETAGERLIFLTVRDLTDQRKAEEALRQAQQRLALAVKAGQAGTFDWDAPTNRNEWSKELLALYGIAPGEFGGRYEDWIECVVPDDREAGAAAVKRSLETGEFAVEFRIRRRDNGEIHWMDGRGKVLFDEAGQPVRMIGMNMDITERKQAEERLRKSEVRQAYLLQLGDTLRPLSDPVEVQEAAARVLGEHLDTERVLYFEVREPDYVVERDYARNVPHLRGRFPIADFGPKLWEAYQAGRTVVVKDVQTDGSLTAEDRPAYAAIQVGAHVGVPLVKGGRLVAGLAVHAKARREWTAEETGLIEETAERTWSAVGRARAEEALRQSEENYRTLFTSIDEGFCVIEMFFDGNGKPNDWRFVEVNPAFEKHNGLVRATGKRIRELAPDLEAKWFEIYGNVALTGQATRFVESSEALNRWFDLYAFRVGEPGEHKVAVLFADITARKRAEAELAQYRQELERLVAERTARLQELVGELEHFSYTITHDLKAPLRAMRGFAEMAEQVSGEGEAKPFLEKISTAAERMDRLIADALSYSRLVRQDLPLEDVDTEALLRGILDSYPQFQPWKAQIQVEGRLPVVLGNEAGLTQVFSNLLDNAVKFVQPAKKPDIRVWATERGEWARIWVEDKGIGISRVMLPRVFEMFSRGSKDYEGTGIGLALVRKVVQRMGGKVGVESEEGSGSRFWVELKIGEARALFAPATTLQAEGAAEGTVLYAEDEEGDALFMERAFAQKGIGEKLRLVRTGRAAIDYLSGSAEFGDREKYPVPAVVLLDLNLPQVSGFGVLEWIRNHPDYARLPVVVFSSSTREDDRAKARELGADEFITKPSSGLEFGRVVDQLKERWAVRGMLKGI